MTETMNINAMKNKVLMTVIVLAAFVAIAATAIAATAKPAEAATCASKAYRPAISGSSLVAHGEIVCTGSNNTMRQITVSTELQRQNANGGWSVVGTAADTRYNLADWGTVYRKACSSPYPYGVYRTKVTGYTIAGNGYRHAYGPTYSVKSGIYC